MQCTDDNPRNCLTWALRQRRLYGGRILVMFPSYNYWGPHFLWLAGEGHPACLPGEVYERVAVEVIPGVIIPPLDHEGYIRRVW